jgi:hypothetical protein
MKSRGEKSTGIAASGTLAWIYRWLSPAVVEVSGKIVSCLSQPVTFAIRFQDVTPVSKPVQQRRCESIGAKDLRPFLKGQVGNEHEATILMGPADDLEDHFGFWIKKSDTHTATVLGSLFYCLTPARFRFW